MVVRSGMFVMRLPQGIGNATLVIAGPILVTVLLTRSGVLSLTKFFFLILHSGWDERAEGLQMGEK